MLGIFEEPHGQTYDDLLRFAAANCATFSLTWHLGRYKSTAHQIGQELTPYCISQKLTDHWPGTTRLHYSEKQPNPIHGRYRIARPKGILLRTYQAAPPAIDVLQSVGSLYAWLGPDRPEDLAFYLPDGSTFLASVAHEELSWFMSDMFTQETIRRNMPGLSLYDEYERSKEEELMRGMSGDRHNRQ